MISMMMPYVGGGGLGGGEIMCFRITGVDPPKRILTFFNRSKMLRFYISNQV